MFQPIVARRFLAAILAALLAFAPAGPALAQDAWRFEGTPYLWAAGMKGDVGVGRLSATGVEMTFPDILKDLRIGFMGSLEGRKGDAGFLLDLVYMKLDQDQPAPAPFLGDVQARPTQAAYTGAFTYRVSKGAMPVDLLAGVRVNDVKLDLSLSSSALAPGGRRVGRSRTWTDGFVGARVEVPVAPRWTLTAYGDIGAGGSDSTWQVMAGANYALSPKSTAKFGYRQVRVDYHRDEFLFDMASGGLYGGLALQF